MRTDMAVDLKKWALLAEIVGGIGIVVSVLYLAFEVSRNTTNVQAANALAISSETMQVRSQQVENDDLNELIGKASNLDALTANERNRFFVHTLNRLTLWENLLLMDNQDLLPEEFFAPLDEGYCANFRTSGYRAVWELFPGAYFTDRLHDRVAKCLEGDSTLRF